MKSVNLTWVVLLYTSICYSAITVPVDKDPNYQSTLNPNYNSSINPNYSSTINPKYNSSINPTYSSSINPDYSSSINPKYASSINPTYSSSINPTYTSSINPNYSSWSGYFLFDISCNLLGILVETGTSNYNYFNTSGTWISYASSNKQTGYNLFTLTADWTGYFMPNSQGNLNYFDKLGNWLGFAIRGSGNAIGVVPPSKPDFYPDSLTATYSSGGDSLNIRFIVINQGNLAASCYVKWIYEAIHSDSIVLSTLNPGYYIAVTTRIPIIDTLMSMQVQVDPRNLVAESNENNNTISLSWNTNLPQPDLIIDSLRTQYIRDSLWVWFQLLNSGTSTATSGIIVTLYENDSLVWTYAPTSNPLPSQYYYSFYYNSENPNRGAVTIRVCADATNIVKEASEQNNCSSVRINVPASVNQFPRPNLFSEKSTKKDIVVYDLSGRRIQPSNLRKNLTEKNGTSIFLNLSNHHAPLSNQYYVLSAQNRSDIRHLRKVATTGTNAYSSKVCGNIISDLPCREWSPIAFKCPAQEKSFVGRANPIVIQCKIQKENMK
jgi:hypothetical protein